MPYHRRSSSTGAQLFQERGEVGRHVPTMSVLTEDDEDEDTDNNEKSEDHATASSREQGNIKTEPSTENKQATGVKEIDPLAALGDKLAKLRCFYQ